MLLQYEFQRANREVNMCQRKGIRLNNQLTRATKRIEKMTSVFDKAKSALNTRWDNQQREFSQCLSNLALGIASTSGGDGEAAAAQFNYAVSQMIIGGISLGTLIKIPTINVSGANGDSTKINQIIQTAISSAVGQAQQMVQQLIQNARDIDQATLEGQQDAQMAPLAEKEADIQAEKSLNDVLTDLWKERQENAHSKLPDAIKDSMSGFGLK